MPFATQFALSLEATSLVPLALTAANKATEAIMSLARDLQNSGSDIVVEEDLASVFGRLRIVPQLESSFKTMILQHRETTPLVENIFLQSGPGPTVTRALKHPPYFSMVVQLSLLSWVHEKNSLAGAIKQVLDKRLEGAPADMDVRAVPSQNGLLGVLCACEEQTASYDWNGLLSAVASLLGVSRMGFFDPLPLVVLGGLLDMFAIIQSLPEDRLIYVRGSQGTCILCVWAHHVLGLTVLVKMKDEKEIRLGPGNDQVIVDCRDREDPSISLLDGSGDDILISVKSDEEDFKIDAAPKLSVQGCGRSLLLEDSPNEDVAEEMMLLTVAIALVANEHLQIKHRCKIIERCAVKERKILEVARLLFDKPALTIESVNRYIEEYREKKPVEHEPTPLLKKWGSLAGTNDLHIRRRAELSWPNLHYTSHQIVALILSFSHVRDLSTCANLPFRVTSSHMLPRILQTWDGKSDLDIPHDTWFSVIATLMFGHERLPTDACLISDRGWSVFVSTFSDADPSFIDPRYVSVVRGVPSRHGIRKTGITDGPNAIAGPYHWTAVEKAGDTAILRCSTKVEQSRIQCGEQRDVFILSIPLKSHNPELDCHQPVSGRTSATHYMVRTGYRRYFQALWLAQRSRRCEHSPQEPQEIRLPPDSATVTGIVATKAFHDLRILILLTAGNRFARWGALVGYADNGRRQMLLRGYDCCFACVVSQAASQPGKWVIIL